MTPHFHIMPVDRSTIQTRIAIHPDCVSNANAFCLDRNLPIRTIKPTLGRRSGRSVCYLTLDVLAYKGIKLHLAKVDSDPLAYATIEFNPGVCLYGHNGRVLLLTEFHDALALLVTNLRPLLHNPDDQVDLVPGLRPGGYAFWSYLEVLLQCRDTDGALLAQLRHLRHPDIRTQSRHWPTSIKDGGQRSKLHLSIYRKAVEMVEHSKLPERYLPRYKDVLRLETRMHEEKLVNYFGNGHNVEVINGVERLVRFYPQDLVHGHRMCYTKLQGVFAPDDGAEDVGITQPNVALGKLLAMVALDPRSSHTLPQLLSLLKIYTGASSKTIGNIRNAGMAELSRRSTISCDNLFSDAAYSSQNGIASGELEQMICHRVADTVASRSIIEAYSPPGQPPNYATDWPSYCL